MRGPVSENIMIPASLATMIGCHNQELGSLVTWNAWRRTTLAKVLSLAENPSYELSEHSQRYQRDFDFRTRLRKVNSNRSMNFNRNQLKARCSEQAAQGVYIGTSSWKYEGWIGQLYTAWRKRPDEEEKRKLLEQHSERWQRAQQLKRSSARVKTRSGNRRENSVGAHFIDRFLPKKPNA